MKIKKYIYFIVFISLNVNQLICSPLEKVFTYIYEKRIWGGGKETRSGSGSMLQSTKNIRKKLPELIKKFNIKTILDIPCGDFNWFKSMNLEVDTYIGADIVKNMITTNNKLYGSKTRHFMQLNATKDILPKVDLILCRDLFLHLSIADIFLIIKNFKKSKSTYLLVSTYLGVNRNIDIISGGYIKNDNIPGKNRHINLTISPFNFPEPMYIIEEDVAKHHNKCLALWKLEDIPT